MMEQNHKLWLKVSAVAIFIYAALFSLGSIEGLSKPIELVLDLSNWPLDKQENYNAPTSAFLSAILGGVLFGWGMLIWSLSSIYHLAPSKVRKIAVISMISWFLLDSLGCLLSHNSSNAITNIFLLIVLLGPLSIPIKTKP